MNSSPLVSIIMPVFNSADTIEETINSVINQTYPNWEIICVDDGSTDESEAIVNRISQKEYRLHFYKRDRLPKSGSTCRNIGAFNASGEYLIFLDSDDLLSPSCLETRVNAIHNSNYDFVVFPVATFCDGDLEHRKTSENIRVKDYEYFFAASFSAWHTTSPIIRKSFFLEQNGFDESFPRLQDIEFHLRAIIGSNGRHLILPQTEADCYYRLAPSGYSIQKLQNTLVAYSRFYSLLLRVLESGALSNKKKISRSVLLLFSNLSIIKHSIWKNGADISEWSTILDCNIKNYISNGVWLVVNCLNRSYKSKLQAFVNYFMGRCLLHYCMFRFKKICLRKKLTSTI